MPAVALQLHVHLVITFTSTYGYVSQAMLFTDSRWSIYLFMLCRCFELTSTLHLTQLLDRHIDERNKLPTNSISGIFQILYLQDRKATLHRLACSRWRLWRFAGESVGCSSNKQHGSTAHKKPVHFITSEWCLALPCLQ